MVGGLLARTDHQLLTISDHNAHAYYHADGNGNVTAMVNTNGIVLARYNYDPYGSILGMSGPLAEANTYRFSTKEFHAASALYYYGYRFYAPSLQRWLNRDLIGEQGGINLFTFVNNSPVIFFDPLGLASVCERPLQNPLGGLITPFVGEGYPAKHRQIFFDDHEKQKADPKKYPSNLGLFDDDKVKPDPTEKEKPDLFKKYEKKTENLDDATMREAVENVKKEKGTDWTPKRNCQDFVDEVLNEYFKIKDKEIKEKQKQPPIPQNPAPRTTSP